MRQTAADGAAITDLIMCDVLDGLHQERMNDGKLRVFENIAPAHHSAERHGIAGDLDLAQFREFAQIDKQSRRGEAKRQHRHQRLAAGERLGFAIMRRQ